MTDRLLHVTTTLCATCRNAVEGRVVDRDGAVFMTKTCPDHGPQEAWLSDDAAWYARTRAIRPKPVPPRMQTRPVDKGCPFDCGPCKSHSQKVRLPVVTITSACNLDCPICYVYNHNANAYEMDLDEFRRILHHICTDHGDELDLVNFTGGEPTMHPRFVELLEIAAEVGIKRVTICTNGIRLAREEALVERLASLGARVALSFDSFETEADFKLQGAHLVALKLKCLALLEKHGVDVTLIPVMTKGVNDHEIGKILELGLNSPSVRHVEVHTITYTGQGGTTFDPGRSGRISMHEVLVRIAETTGGLLTPDDFVPSPCAHPLCYAIAYLLLDPEGGAPVPFTRFMPREAVYEALADRLYLEPSPFLEAALQEAIDRLWVDDTAEAARTLRALKALITSLFPSDGVLSKAAALRVSERAVKAVYVHSHMDEETFDVERAALCCDSNVYADGTTVPVCNSNVLYRDKDARFVAKPKAWNARTGGKTVFP
jgi:uncharacterized radical SAM superfamily Fe-S cluster-containing enzyme